MPQMTVFDTYEYVRELKEAGVPEEQARIHAAKLARLFDQTLATKEDLRKLKEDVAAEVVKWVLVLLLVQAGFVAALVKLL